MVSKPRHELSQCDIEKRSDRLRENIDLLMYALTKEQLTKADDMIHTIVESLYDLAFQYLPSRGAPKIGFSSEQLLNIISMNEHSGGTMNKENIKMRNDTDLVALEILKTRFNIVDVSV